MPESGKCLKRWFSSVIYLSWVRRIKKRLLSSAQDFVGSQVFIAFVDNVLSFSRSVGGFPRRLLGRKANGNIKASGSGECFSLEASTLLSSAENHRKKKWILTIIPTEDGCRVLRPRRNLLHPILLHSSYIRLSPFVLCISDP